VSLPNSYVVLIRPSIPVGGIPMITMQVVDVDGNNETSGGLKVAFKLNNTG